MDMELNELEKLALAQREGDEEIAIVYARMAGLTQIPRLLVQGGAKMTTSLVVKKKLTTAQERQTMINSVGVGKRTRQKLPHQKSK